MSGSIAHYDVAYIGQALKENELSQVTLPASSLTECRGEIGNFTLSYQAEEELDQIQTSNVVINLPHQEELPVEGCLSLTGVGDEFLAEADGDKPLIIIQDYQELSAAALSQRGLKLALQAKSEDPAREVYYFYQAMRFMDDNDELYEEARRQEVIFLKHDLGELEISQDGEVFYSREDIELNLSGKLVVAPELKPAAEVERLARIFNITRGPEGYLQVDNVYLQPTLSGKRGLYVLGGARGPNALTYQQEEREYTLQEIKRNLIGVEELDEEERSVDDQKCVVCYTCYRVCPHGAIQRDEELNSMQIMPLACQSCNLCISRCPMGAITRSGEIEEQPQSDRQVIICENSAALAREKADSDPMAGLEVTEVPCVSTVKKEHIYQRLAGSEGDLLILGCISEACKHLTGHDRCEQVVSSAKSDLEKLDLDPERVNYQRLSPRMAADLSAYLADWKGEVLQ